MSSNNKMNLWCTRQTLEEYGTPSDLPRTITCTEQLKVEQSIHDLFDTASYAYAKEEEVVLERNKHIAYLKKGLKSLSTGFECLDASRPWLVYWSVHSLTLLGEKLEEETARDVCEFLRRCQHPEGGFGGGPQQFAHLAPTYAAVNVLVTIGTPEALSIVNRQQLANFLLRMKTEEGAFRMHEGGEVDIRGTYCAVSVAKLLRLALKPLFSDTPSWLLQCQTYEGGFSGTPGLEAHGGYTFCGMAAMALLNTQHLVDSKSLLRWAASRQMQFSGGFQGRTNKLVDGCYSFWQGGIFPILHRTLADEGNLDESVESEWLFHCEALQNYLLVCCQHKRGGMLDKPNKNSDFYHTCYCLSGMSVAQNYCYNKTQKTSVVGHPSNKLEMTHPLYNVVMTSVVAATRYFSELPVVTPSIDNGVKKMKEDHVSNGKSLNCEMKS